MQASADSAVSADASAQLAIEPPPAVDSAPSLQESDRTSSRSDKSRACTWVFTVDVRVVDVQNFEPTYFSTVLSTRQEKLQETMRHAKIISYSCLGLDKASGIATFDGFIHAGLVRLGSLNRWLTHPDIVGSVRWIPVLDFRRYIDHPAIKAFLEETALPSSNSSQPAAAVGRRLRVDYLQSSDTSTNKGGRPRKRDAAAASTAPPAADSADGAAATEDAGGAAAFASAPSAAATGAAGAASRPAIPAAPPRSGGTGIVPPPPRRRAGNEWHSLPRLSD